MKEGKRRRITLARNKFWSLKHTFESPFQNDLKSAIFNRCIVPTLLDGARTWFRSAKIENNVRITRNRMQRSILNLNFRDRIPIKIFKAKLKNNIGTMTTSAGLNGTGRVVRIPDNR